VPAPDSGSGTRCLHVAFSIPIARDVTPDHPSRATPGVFVLRAALSSNNFAPRRSAIDHSTPLRPSLHQSRFALLRPLCYGRRWPMKMNSIAAEATGRAASPSDSAGASAVPVCLLAPPVMASTSDRSSALSLSCGRCLPGNAGLPTGASAVPVDPAGRTPGLPASAGVLRAHLTHGRAFRTAGVPRGTKGIPAGSLAFSRVITHQSPARQPKGGSLITDFLIYGSAIRNPRKALKT
jgi:hypothetical protein